MQTLFALLAAIACVWLGMLASRRLQEREKLLQSWETALQKMEGAIAHHPASLPDLFRRSAGEYLPWLTDAARLLEAEPALSPQTFFARLPAFPLLTAPETETILEGLTGLFAPDPRLQLQSLARAREQLIHFHRLNQEATVKNGQLYWHLGFLSGAALFILIC